MRAEYAPGFSPYYLAFPAILIIVTWRFLRPRSNFPRPPGPAHFPLLGNLLDIPRGPMPWREYDEHFKKFGDIVHFSILGTHLFVIGSSKRATDLFEKRSSVYSGRGHHFMAYNLIGWSWLMVMQPYGVGWRKHRRLFHEYFHPTATTAYWPAQTKAARTLLTHIAETPTEFLHHIRHSFVAAIMSITYDIDIAVSNDDYAATAEQAMESLSISVVPGAFLVDLVPSLAHLPNWFPGAKFKTLAAQWGVVVDRMRRKPFEAVKSAMNQGTAGPSLAATMIEKLPTDDKRAEEEEVVMNVTASMLAGGADTTVSAVQSFFLAMALYPDVQRKAHAELDAVLGPNKLPEFADRSSLPYISAVVKEAFRWQPVTPFSVHAATADDVYDGYFIPKGSLVMGSIWSILHNPEMYPDPERFHPDRFMKDGKLDREVPDPTATFGFGRRICPGRFMSDHSLYITIASVLAAFEITSPTDLAGKPMTVDDVQMTFGIISHPHPFKCTIKPRSIHSSKLLQELKLTNTVG